jgi:hypothetical protein
VEKTVEQLERKTAACTAAKTANFEKLKAEMGVT